jgi:hypothetical protein
MVLVDGVGRIIGKGRNRRRFAHATFACMINKKRTAGQKIKATRLLNNLAKAIREGSVITYEILASEMNDNEAFARERIEIAKRRDQLWNVLEGGEGFSSADIRAMHADPEYAKARDERLRKLHAELREENAERLRKFNTDLEFGKLRIEGWRKRHDTDPDFRKAHAERLRKRHTDPEFRKAHAEGIRRREADSEYAKVRNERWRKFNADPEFRARRIAGLAAARRPALPS